MKTNSLLKILNPILAVLVLNQVLTALLRDSLSLQAFAALHQGGGIILAVGSVLHLTLNWNWVRANFRKKKAAPSP